MRRREEKRRKFHEAVLNILYPPPPSPPKQENQEEEEVVNILQEGFMVDSIPVPDDLEETGCGSTSSSDDLESGPQKLTRAQRKRLRKKKLNEAASQRRKIIGPLLPSTSDELGSSGGGGGVLENEPPSVRQNATETPNAAIDEPGGETPPLNCSNHHKLKHRRKAKIRAREMTKSSCMEQSNQDSQPCDKHENSN